MVNPRINRIKEEEEREWSVIKDDLYVDNSTHSGMCPYCGSLEQNSLLEEQVGDERHHDKTTPKKT